MTESGEHTYSLDIRQILKILPHRYPFLLIDRVVEMDIEKGIVVAQKNVTMNEGFFQGHFPEVPIMPGVLILEAMAQTGGILVHCKGAQDKIAILLSANHVKFRHPVKPGDQLIMRGEGVHFSQKGGKVQVQAKVDERVVAEAEIGFVFVEKDQI